MKQQERVFCLGFMALKIDYDGHKVNSFKNTPCLLAMNKHRFFRTHCRLLQLFFELTSFPV